MITDSVKINRYEGKQIFWEKGSSIRTRPRRILSENEECDYYFPISRQPLCIHPSVIALGEASKIYILTQSVYRFMTDIAILETEVVNHGALMVANNKLNIPFADALRHDALSVIIDEAYHAYVAIDFINQIESKTGIKPIPFINEAISAMAIKSIKELLPCSLHDIFELVAICIGEHVLTKDLISIGKETAVSKTFSQVMADHILDEGRHANIFHHILEFLWVYLEEDKKNIIGPYIPLYMMKYLEYTSSIQKDYDFKILSSLSLSSDEITKIMYDTYTEHQYNQEPILKNNPIILNLLQMLERSHVLEHDKTMKAFKKNKFI